MSQSFRSTSTLTTVKALFFNTVLVLAGIAAVLLTHKIAQQTYFLFFEVQNLEMQKRIEYQRVVWIWQMSAFLPALAVGLLAKRKPILLTALLYFSCCVYFSLDGHGKFAFEESWASYVIFGDVRHIFHPPISHGKIILQCLREVGTVLAIAVALALPGVWIHRRLRSAQPSAAQLEL
ncbi:MAG TPA: hypothetical protein VGI93_11400 [Steroidobacteraceae bacterium]